MGFWSRTVFVIVLICATGHAKGQNSAFADTKLYDVVVERLFQHDLRAGLSEIQLRYTYCDAGELQIVVHKLSNSDFQLTVWHVPSGSPSVWNQLARLVSSKPLDADDVVPLIKMIQETVVVRGSTTLAKLLEGADSISISLLKDRAVTLDGMAYGLSVRSVSEDLTLTLQGPQRSEQSGNQLIRWMGQVRSQTESQLQGASK